MRSAFTPPPLYGTDFKPPSLYGRGRGRVPAKLELCFSLLIPKLELGNEKREANEKLDSPLSLALSRKGRGKLEESGKL
jgi:hypothetical protein